MANLLVTLLVISISINAYFVWRVRRIQPEYTSDARELLHHLTSGGAVVKVDIIDPSKLLLYRG